MKTHSIGNTGVVVSELGFGTSALGNMPDTYGYEVTEARAAATLSAVFDSPVTLVDTSRNYGMGESEARIGAALRDRGGSTAGVVISTKLDRDMDTNRFDAYRARRSLEASLEALGVDRVPILHLHDPEYAADLSEVTRKGGALTELFRMKEEGLAQAVGLAMGRLDVMQPILKDWPFDVLISHNRFTLLNRSADQVFSDAHAAGIAIFNAAPFASGVLAKGSANYNRVTYQETDAAGLAPVRAVEDACARHGVAPGAAALQFSMRDPRIMCTLAGASRPESVRQTLDWASAELPQALWDDLAELTYATDDPEASRVYRPG